MGKHTYHRDHGSRERGSVSLHEKVSIGAAGVATPLKKLSMDVVRTGAGVYTCTLIEKFQGLLDVHVMQIGAIQDLSFHVTSDSVSVDGSFELTCAVAGAPTDPLNGSILAIKAEVKNSSVER